MEWTITGGLYEAGYDSLSSPITQFNFATCGNKIFQLYVEDTNECKDSIPGNVDIWCEPTANFNSQESCVGDTTFLTDISTNGTGNINQWSWNMGGTGTYVGGSSSTSQDPIFIYDDCGTYHVTLTVTDDNDCTDDTTITVEVYCEPEPNFSSNTVCEGDTTLFTDLSVAGPSPSAAIVSWNWTMNSPGQYVGGTTNTSTNPQYIFDSCGTHNVTLEVTDANGCVASITIPIEVWCNPTAFFDAPPLACLRKLSPISLLISSLSMIISLSPKSSAIPSRI